MRIRLLLAAAVCLSLFILASPSPFATGGPDRQVPLASALTVQVSPSRVAPSSCKHTHTRAQSRRAVRIIMRSPRRVSKARGRKVWHYLTCVRTAATAHYMREFLKRWKAWRRSYEGRWTLAFERMSQTARDWATSTMWCESGNQRAYNPAGPWYSFMQWSLSTWYAAGGDRPPYQASFHQQAVLAWPWHLSHPHGQWPVCGE